MTSTHMLLRPDVHCETGVSGSVKFRCTLRNRCVSKEKQTLYIWQVLLSHCLNGKMAVVDYEACEKAEATIVWRRYRSAGQGVLHNALHLRLDVVMPQALLGTAGIQVI